MNSAARFREAAVIKAQRDIQDRRNLLHIKEAQRACRRNLLSLHWGGCMHVFIYLLISFFIFLRGFLPLTGGDSWSERGFPVSAENMQMQEDGVYDPELLGSQIEQ